MILMFNMFMNFCIYLLVLEMMVIDKVIILTFYMRASEIAAPLNLSEGFLGLRFLKNMWIVDDCLFFLIHFFICYYLSNILSYVYLI